MATKAVTDSSFQTDVLDSDKPVVVDFWAEWCGPCKMIGPSLEELSEELGEQVTIVKVNIDENPDAPGKYGVRGIPTMILFKTIPCACYSSPWSPWPASWRASGRQSPCTGPAGFWLLPPPLPPWRRTKAPDGRRR
jgi:thioredoxin 1